MTGEPLPAVLPATAAASADGQVGEGHGRVVSAATKVVSRIPDLEPAVVAAAEAILAEHAVTLSPPGLAKTTARLSATLDLRWIDPKRTPRPGGRFPFPG